MWERQRPFLPVSKRRCGRWRDHRQVIDGILHRVGPACSGVTGPNASGRGRPSTNGTGGGRPTGRDSVCFSESNAPPTRRVKIDWEISVDSTVVRAHQHAEGRTYPPPVLPQILDRPAGARDTHLLTA